ncbi:MAG: LuxR C-terminal-related transcriptional regulator [Planctomycetota bacterium]|nr:LuxR C-terminal-related transcriptional regulator [Planctomycetota bacterium]
MHASWHALAQDISDPVLVVDLDARIRLLNRAASPLFGVRAAEGGRLGDLFSQEYTAEHTELIRRAAETGSLRFEDIVRGRRVLSTLRAVTLRAAEAAVTWTMSPLRAALALEPVGTEFPRASVADMGALAALTPRELEVLRHIGEGLSQREIAALLHRTVKTIEAHRAALGRKLGLRKNVQLAQVAIDAGL